MKRRLVQLITVAILLAGLVHAASAETCSLELKPVPSLDPQNPRSRTAAYYLYRNTYPQRLFIQIDAPGRPTSDEAAAGFSKLVRKQPDKYETEHPIRGVAKLGSRTYAFVVDAVGEKKRELPARRDTRPATAPPTVQAIAYNRLFFDLNGNGDLTDDGVVDALSTPHAYQSASYASRAFPRVDITIDVDGTKVAYAFRLSVYSRVSSNYSYAYVSLYSAAYREGTVTVAGKPRRIVLLDYNSNGRFDDEFAVQTSGSVYPSNGDMLMVDPDTRTYTGTDVSGDDYRHYVSKTVNIDGRFYDLRITPAGDKLTLTASSVPVGYVTNPNDGFRAVVYGDQGLLKIATGKTSRAPLPVGQWRLVSYTITQAEERDSPARSPDAPQSIPAQLGTRYHRVTARGTGDGAAIEVRAGQTATLAFGPPYKPVVTLSSLSKSAGVRSARLGLSLVGAGGERCSGLTVSGRRPPRPIFTITSPDGKEIARGSFEYG